MKFKMLKNRRKKYLDEISYIVTAQPELMYCLILLICDELSISDIDRIYTQIKLIASNPPITKQELIKRN